MELQEQFNESLRVLRQNLPAIQAERFPDDAIVKEIHRLFPDSLLVITEAPAAPKSGITTTLQYGVNWNGYTFTITRKK